jgi:hypothetical protein
MGRLGIVEEGAALVDAGEFNAEVVNVQETCGQYGPTVNIEFKLCNNDEWNGCPVTGLAKKKLSAGTKLGQWVKAILGRMPDVGEEVTTEDLLKKQCRIVIKHRTSLDGKTTFANVVDVLDPTIPF